MLDHVGILVKNNLKNNICKKTFSFACTALSPMLIMMLFGGKIKERTFVGFLIMFIFFKAFSSMENVTCEKYEGIYERVIASPIKVYEYYAASLISGFVVMVLQICVCFFCVSNFLEVDLQIGYIYTFIILVFIGTVALSMATFCICITDDMGKLDVISYFVSLGFSVLGGCYVEISEMPLIVQKISYFIPTTWAMDGIDKMTAGGGAGQLWCNMLVLILFAIFFFVAGVFVAKKTEVNEKNKLV